MVLLSTYVDVTGGEKIWIIYLKSIYESAHGKFYIKIAFIKTYEKLKGAGVKVNLHVGEKIGLVYPLYPIKEAKQAKNEIIYFILKH